MKRSATEHKVQPEFTTVTGDAERRKRVRRNAIVLALVAAAFYLGFIAMSVLRSRH